MKTSDNGIAMTKSFEGFSAVPYNDSDGNSTIGNGCLLHSGPVDYSNAIDAHFRDNPMTEEEADAMLRQHVKGVCEPKLNRLLLTCPLNQNQFDALSDFVYHQGDFTNDTLNNKFKNNHLLKALKSGQYGDVPEQLMRWVYGGGKIQNGLVKRQQAEVQMWQWGTWVKSQATNA
jgi:GH24 family phage-related lysozyme (muramidase)